MVFTKRLRESIRRGRIKCSIRVWMRPHVKVGGRYSMDDGHIVVDSIEPIEIDDITQDLARESGFANVDDLLQIARHGKGEIQEYICQENSPWMRKLFAEWERARR